MHLRLNTYATSFQKAVYGNTAYLVHLGYDTYGLYAPGKSLFYNEFKTRLMAAGTREQLETWTGQKLYTRKELRENANQERQEVGSIDPEVERKIESGSDSSSGRSAREASNWLQRNKSRCSMFLRRLSP